MSDSVERHLSEMIANRDYLEKKPILKKIYQQFYEKIADQIQNDHDGHTVELGSGIANIKSVIPHCITTDLFANPWVDQTENAFALSFKNDSVANLILFDVFHHLKHPGTALKEFFRVLTPGGRLVIFDPDVSLLGRIVYGCFHPEPIGFKESIEWLADKNFEANEPTYYAAQGNAHRIFVKDEFPYERLGFQKVFQSRNSALTYVASGGYSKPQLYPDSMFKSLRALESLLNRFPGLFSTRLLVAVEKSY